MNLQQWIIKQAAKLRKEFPEQGGVFAVVVTQQRHTSMNEGFEGDPTADNSPDFIRKDNEGWQVIGRYNGK